MKTKILTHWFDLVVALGILISLVFFIWPIRFFPYTSEVSQLLINGSLALQQRSFEPLILQEFEINHPPVAMLYLNSIWSLFGENTTTSHMAILPFGFLLLISTYYISKKYTSLPLAILNTFLLGFLPVLVTNLQLIEIYYMMASLMALSLALWIYDQKYLSMIVLAGATLINLGSVMLLPVLFVDWWQNGRKYRWQVFLLPIGSLLIWLFYHSSVTGWWFVSPRAGALFSATPDIYLRYIGVVFYRFASSQLNWIFLIPSIIIFSFFGYQKKLSQSELKLGILFIGLWIVSSVYFGFMGNYQLHKSLFLYPLLIVLFTQMTSKAIEYLFQEKIQWIQIVTLSLLCLIALSQWRVNRDQGPGFKFGLDTNLAYQDQVLVFREALAYLEATHSDAVVYGGFPEANYLPQPHLGYVTQPISYDSCENFQINSSLKQIVLIHPYHPSQIACQEVIKNPNLTPLKQFTKNGKWIELFQVNQGASPSAQIQP